MTTLKRIVPDTSVLITNPRFLQEYLENQSNNEIILPFTVLKELSNFKHETSERGKHSRDNIRFLKELAAKYNTKLCDTIHTKGSVFKIELNCEIDLGLDVGLSDNDSRIISVAKKHNAVLFTQDNAMSIIAESFGVEVQTEGFNQAKEIYEGIRELNGFQYMSVINDIYSDGFSEDITELAPTINEYLVLKSGQSSVITRTERTHEGDLKLVRVDTIKSVNKVKPRGVRQSCALDLLSDPEIRIAGLIGQPGGGKTFLSLAVALDLVLNQKAFEKLIIVKSAVGVGGAKEELGFLPGELDDKTAPIFHNLSSHIKTLIGDKNAKNQQFGLPQLKEKGLIEFKPVQYVRGENFANSLILIDELQNFPQSTVKTLLTRVDYNTSKVIFTGDNEQVDSPYLNSFHNGLYLTVEKLKGKPYFGLITLDKSHRGDIAEDIVKLFE